MCGIVGIVSTKSCVNEVIKGLRSLEYRGYDSAGIAIINQNKILKKKSVGRIIDLEKKINKNINVKEILLLVIQDGQLMVNHLLKTVIHLSKIHVL